MSTKEPLIRARDVTVKVAGSDFCLGPVDFDCWEGTHTTVLGQNGSGKSTLLRVLAGLCPATTGQVFIAGLRSDQMSPRMRAQRISLMTDLAPTMPGLRVEEVVLTGRFPHQGFAPFDRPEDLRAVERALELTDTQGFRERSIKSLSLGERQRVLLARALAQEPQVLLLDEPSSHLDIARQLELEQRLLELRRTLPMAIVAVSHDFNVSTRHADSVILLKNGRVFASGATTSVLTAAALSAIYDADLETVTRPGSLRPWFLPRD